MRDLTRPLSDENAAQLIAAPRDRRDFSALSKSIHVPTLATGGREDALSPPEIMAQIEGAHHAILESAAHPASLEQSEAWNDVIQSWRRQARLK